MKKYRYFTLNKNRNYFITEEFGYKIKKENLTFYATKVNDSWRVSESTTGLLVFKNILNFKSISKMLDKEVCNRIIKILNQENIKKLKGRFEKLKNEYISRM